MNWITNFVRPKLQAFVGKKKFLTIYGKLALNARKCFLKESWKIISLFVNIVTTILELVQNKGSIFF